MIRHSTMRGIADDYIRNHRRAAERELAYFKVLRTDEEVISKAARCLLPSGRRQPHQYRIPAVVLAEGERRLVENMAALRAAPSFEDLHDRVERLIVAIRGIGELSVYDISLRIGARFDLEPTGVYLHRGTRVGALALGFDGRRKRIEITELPAELRHLSPRELEDLLCIYKDSLATATSAGDGDARQ